MSKMTMERRNEIAYLYVMGLTRRRGVPNLKPNEIKREIGNTAKSLGISFEEASEFAHGLISFLVSKAFPEPTETPTLAEVEQFAHNLVSSAGKTISSEKSKPLLGPASEDNNEIKTRLVGDDPGIAFPNTTL